MKEIKKQAHKAKIKRNSPSASVWWQEKENEKERDQRVEEMGRIGLWCSISISSK